MLKPSRVELPLVDEIFLSYFGSRGAAGRAAKPDTGDLRSCSGAALGNCVPAWAIDENFKFGAVQITESRWPILSEDVRITGDSQ